jgi:DNA-binding PadR family transcriptional regulator
MNITPREETIPLTPLAFHILLVLAQRPMYGYGIYQQCLIDTKETISFDRGSIYRTLRRLEESYFIESSEPMRGADNYHQRTYYMLTHVGEQALDWEADRYAEGAALAKYRLKQRRENAKPKPLPLLPQLYV